MTLLNPAAPKEDFEKEKLRLEIAELNRSFWRKPAFWAVFAPIGLTLLTLYFGFEETKKFLANEKTLLEIKQLKLEEQVAEEEAKFESARAANAVERARIAALLAEETERLEKERESNAQLLSDAKAELDRQLADAKKEYEAARADLDRERVRLAGELVELSERVDEKEAELKRVQEQLSNADTHNFIKLILEEGTPIHAFNAYPGLIRKMRDDPQAQEIVRATVEEAETLAHKAGFLAALHAAQRPGFREEDGLSDAELEKVRQVFGEVRDFVSQHAGSAEVWYNVRSGEWIAAEEIALLDILVKANADGVMSDETFTTATSVFHAAANEPEEFARYLEGPEKDALVERMMKLVVEDKVSSSYLSWNLDGLGYRNPGLFLIGFAKIHADGLSDLSKRADLLDNIFEQHIVDAMQAQGWPDNLVGYDFAAWLGKPDIAPINAALHAGDYTKAIALAVARDWSVP